MKTKFLSVLAISALFFASCSNDDNTTPEVNDGRVLFSSGVRGVTTKVVGDDGDQWEGNEHIGIFMRDNAAGKGIVSSNVDYATTSTGTSATFTSSSPIYYPVNTPAKVDFVAYHPYQASLTNDYGYSVDVAIQSSQSAIDLILAKNDNLLAGFDKTNTSPINLVFDHQLAKVKINVKKGAGVADLTNLAVKITGMNTTADFDISTSSLSNETTIADIIPFDAGSNKYEAILLPTALITQTITFTVGGNTYEWLINDAANNTNNVTSLEKGKVYTFNVTVKKNAVVVTGTITPWQSAGAATDGVAN